MLRNELATLSAYLELREKLGVVEVEGRRYYVAEGDLLLDEDQLSLYAAEREKLARDRAASELIDGSMPLIGFEQWLSAAAEGGRIVRWAEGMKLTYTIDRATFHTSAEAELATRYMREATVAWEATCGIDFEEVGVEQNGSNGSEEPPLFIVRKFDSGGKFIAAAFFPNEPTFRRRILLDPYLFDPSLRFDPVGVVRHELGHVLGFRHEHIRGGAPADCPNENPGIDLTEYDPQSVMHYFCGGVGSRELQITEIDKRGAQLVYGQPHRRVRFFK
ncbi:MAG: matrixin family metalloprotease [Phycisphaerae bacterium]